MSLSDHEWPANVLESMTSGIIQSAKHLRLNSGVPMLPSPDPEAHVRFKESGSRHTVYDGKLSDATDLFLVNNIDAARLWSCALSMPEIGGIGLYFDTRLNGKKRVLIHIDNRKDRLMWLCPSRTREREKRAYIYFREDNPAPFLEILADEFERLRS